MEEYITEHDGVEGAAIRVDIPRQMPVKAAEVIVEAVKLSEQALITVAGSSFISAILFS